jgi:uroporphyrinogen decarboxylase
MLKGDECRATNAGQDVPAMWNCEGGSQGEGDDRDNLMNSRENMRRAIHFQTPARMPLIFAPLGDRWRIGPILQSEWARNNRSGVDHFGCVWAKSDLRNVHDMGQVVGHPLEDWKALKTYHWPDPDDPAHYAGMAGMLAAPEAEGRYIHVGIFMLLFERMHSLRGFARTLEDLYLEPNLSAELADRLVEFDLRVIRNAAYAVGADRIQALTCTDDWATQTGPLVAPTFWRQFFQPRYRRIFDQCHRLGWDVNLHSCGKVNDLIEPLIEAGLDVINLQQPRALGIEEIGRRYRGRICFESTCDIQATLPSKSIAEIRDEARLLMEHWATPQGGFVLYDYGPSETIGSTDEKKRGMLDAFLESDPWAGRNPVLPLPPVGQREETSP